MLAFFMAYLGDVLNPKFLIKLIGIRKAPFFFITDLFRINKNLPISTSGITGHVRLNISHSDIRNFFMIKKFQEPNQCVSTVTTLAISKIFKMQAVSTTLVKHFQLLFKKMSFELLTRIKISPHHYNVFDSKNSIISSSFKSTPVFNRFKRIFLKVFNRV